ncbi:MAG TPA: HAD family phosphatase [Solirubrobacteraceae bacterium]
MVIFDCDGVLVDSEPIGHLVLVRMLAAEGLEMTVEEARLEYQGLLLSEVADKVGASLGRPLAPGWMDGYERERAVAFRAQLQAVPGAEAAVRAVGEAGVAVCVASQGSLAKTGLSLALTGLDEFFPAAHRFSAHDMERGKPHPDLFLQAAATMGAEPSRCAVIEDTTIGVCAAVSAGMRAIGYAAETDAASLRAAGAEPVASLGELPALLGLSGA